MFTLYLYSNKAGRIEAEVLDIDATLYLVRFRFYSVS